MLLFDQNLSDRLVRQLATAFPGPAHVKTLGLAEVEDLVIWARAAQDGYAIVTKHADFHFRALLKGHPPKLIYICLGNCSTEQIANLLLANESVIKTFLADPIESLLMF
jgi:predicted nuclease of predicted toxin-antitoxin system